MFIYFFSLQVFFTVCFLKFYQSPSVFYMVGQNILEHFHTNHIASSMNVVKVRDILEKVDGSIRTGAIFLFYDCNDLIFWTGA